METWAIVTLVLGTSALSSLLTFFITKMQVSHSDKRLEMEIERAREADERRRRWEVRSEPLLRLRDELALMAVKESKVTGAAYGQHLLKDVKPKEELDRRLQEATKNRNDYLESGILQQVINMQIDEELINRVEKIMQEYQSSHFTAEHYTLFGKKDREKGIEVFKQNKARIIEVQDLINKLLEEL